MITYSTINAFNVEMKDVKFLSAGIHENVALVGAKFATSPNGNKFIELTFNKDGATLTHTEYEPTKFGDESDDSLQGKIDSQVKRLMQILKIYYTREQLSYSVADFTGFANWIVALINSADKTKLLRLKVVYNSKNNRIMTY